MSRKEELTDAEFKQKIGYRLSGICCGNCMNKSNLPSGTSYNKDLLKCSKHKLDVSETSVCDHWQHWRVR